MTPTSAIGADARDGFSLVELMVVVALIGLAATAVVLTLPDSSGQVRHEAERLAARLSLARDEAVLSGRATAVRLDAQGYDFLRRAEGRWNRLDEAPLTPDAWPAGVRPAMADAQALVVAFDAQGLADAPANIRLEKEGRTASITVETSGEVRIDD